MSGAPKKFLFVAEKSDESYFGRFSGYFKGASIPVWTGKIDTAAEIVGAARRLSADAIITTRVDFLKKLLPPGREKGAKIDNYAGSLIPTTDPELDVLVLNPLQQLYTKTYGEWLCRRFISKVVEPEKWRKETKFRWKLLESQADYEGARRFLNSCFLISIDIETSPPNIIRCISYCGFTTAGESFAYVFKVDSPAKVQWMRELNASPIAKVCQNGKYECAHFFAYSVPMVNYIADTKNAMHAWMSELPKDLGFLTALLVRDTMYWKDLGNSGELSDLYKYNALDTWGTGEAFISWMAEAPRWAWSNYIKKFRTVPIAHLCEMRGIRQDTELVKKFAEEGEEEISKMLSDLEAMTAVPNFNPRSHLQVKKLMAALGCSPKGKLPESSNSPTLQKMMLKHPLNEKILGSIVKYRELAKVYSTYLTVGPKAKDFKGRILYSLNPDGTDSGRYASSEHHFWTGLQIQNIPAGGPGIRLKQTLIADPGYKIFEIDYRQAEARGVAYCSGDEALLAAVNSPHDFHSTNCSAFFGIPYDEIYDDVTGKTLNKDLRDLAKRVNHGANYNMGDYVLLTTMGEENVRKAQKLLDLPKKWNLLDVCKYLLHRYEVTYPKVKTRYYAYILREIATTNKLVGATGWTRYCFGDPRSSKHILNSYVAHVTQSLNAMILDEAWTRIMKWIIKENLWQDIHLLAQIHDSVLGQVKEGKEHLVEKVAELMMFPVPIKGSDNIERVMTVPTDISINGDRWREYVM